MTNSGPKRGVFEPTGNTVDKSWEMKLARKIAGKNYPVRIAGYDVAMPDAKPRSITESAEVEFIRDATSAMLKLG